MGDKVDTRYCAHCGFPMIKKKVLNGFDTESGKPKIRIEEECSRPRRFLIFGGPCRVSPGTEY